MSIQILRFDLPTVKIDSNSGVVINIFVPFDIRILEDSAYLLQTDCRYVPIYCHVTSSGMSACRGGGWTLVMKIDGQKVGPL